MILFFFSVAATWELSESNKMVAKGDEKSDGLKSRGKGGKDDNDVAVISVGGGYANEAFKDDGDVGGAFTKPPPPPADDIPKGKFKLSRGEKWRILKNVAAVSLSFMVQFTAFQGTANLQSSINAKEGLGTVSLSAIYAALVVSCIFVPTFLIKRLTVKWTLCLSLLCYAPYIASQFYPKFYTLVPAGVLLGLGAAPMWAAKATYLTQVAGVYAKITDQTVDGIVVRFFGFFFLAWQTAELWGNLISSLALFRLRGAIAHHEHSNSQVKRWVRETIMYCSRPWHIGERYTTVEVEVAPRWLQPSFRVCGFITHYSNCALR
ncbi:potassium channel regulator activity protein [Homalodisca vitripennis]|nr:potassium channel regulator activity protein [Homalodisca vitripennis]